jgi:hypothetical protein
MNMEGVMKECCGLCPYSRKDTLFLHPERAEEFAYQAENPYNDFVCHKTGVTDDDDDDDDGGIRRGEKSLTCMGFASMQHNINKADDSFKVDVNAFEDSWEMIEHHTEKHES